MKTRAIVILLSHDVALLIKLHYYSNRKCLLGFYVYLQLLA